ncbi:hypothetical protein CLAVI_000514 [Candidatus Clavichlamydia salmonicola]|uniref:hypothetical protein n=1 Tax=Candidatus Clavichlamydia salmonicola TaxID=469812 RepID=UPI001891B08B|nr:hypothetical protein [Candidatus Clavichlamydia salmonicola]MBF5050892.1 hypothetical protein [Candidatus Clavichlamydia salmonicola]
MSPLKLSSNLEAEKGLCLKKTFYKDLILRIVAVVLFIIATVFLLVGTFAHPPLQSWLIGWMGGAGIVILSAVIMVMASLHCCCKKQPLDLKNEAGIPTTIPIGNVIIVRGALTS